MTTPTYYHPDTPAAVRELLEKYMHTPTRIRLFYGDGKTGRDWGEENDTTGTIGRSGGTQPIPLLIHSRRSYGGPGILDDCIVRMLVHHGREVYRHPTYHQPAYHIAAPPARIGNTDMAAAGYVAGVYADLDGKCENVANFKTRASAEHWIEFMTGRRMCK